IGHEAALFAGIANCTGDAAISIAADRQHPPELILEMVQHWLDGYDVVTDDRENRDKDNSTKKHTAGLFYKVMIKISDT
ncbi:glycosyltransferase, partial [Francisella tularensis subsp. holarctica]|uniref:glycosyltransferase n=1 Tax=Francisella tularensis TaxID=263 RepID=UPI002381CE65